MRREKKNEFSVKIKVFEKLLYIEKPEVANFIEGKNVENKRGERRGNEALMDWSEGICMNHASLALKHLESSSLKKKGRQKMKSR